MSRYLIIPNREQIEESLSLCVEYNLGFELNDYYHPSVLDDEAKCAEIAKFYKGLNAPVLTSHGDFFDVLVFSEDKKIAAISEQRIIQSMEVAKAAGAGAVIFHSNMEPFITAEAYRNNWINKNEEVFRRICAQYPSMNVYMENMFDTEPDEIANLAERMTDVENFGVCFDYAHAFLTNTPLIVWAEALSPYIKHVHINDNDGKNDLHLALGDGTIDWVKFLKLREMYFPEASVLIETTPIENQKKSVKYMKKMGFFR